MDNWRDCLWGNEDGILKLGTPWGSISGVVLFRRSKERIELEIHRPSEFEGGFFGTTLLAPRAYSSATSEYRQLNEILDQVERLLNDEGSVAEMDLTRSHREIKTAQIIRAL